MVKGWWNNGNRTNFLVLGFSTLKKPALNNDFTSSLKWPRVVVTEWDCLSRSSKKTLVLKDSRSICPSGSQASPLLRKQPGNRNFHWWIVGVYFFYFYFIYLKAGSEQNASKSPNSAAWTQNLGSTLGRTPPWILGFLRFLGFFSGLTWPSLVLQRGMMFFHGKNSWNFGGISVQVVLELLLSECRAGSAPLCPAQALAQEL